MTKPRATYAAASTSRVKALAWFQDRYLAACERTGTEPRENLAATSARVELGAYGALAFMMQGASAADDVARADDVVRADALAEHAEKLRAIIKDVRRTAGATWAPSTEKDRKGRTRAVVAALAGHGDPGPDKREAALFGLLAVVDVVAAATTARPKKRKTKKEDARRLRGVAAAVAWARKIGLKPEAGTVALGVIALGIDDPCEAPAYFAARSASVAAVLRRHR